MAVEEDPEVEYVALGGNTRTTNGEEEKEGEAQRRRWQRIGVVWSCVAILSAGLALMIPAIVEWQFRSDLIVDVDLGEKSATYRDFTKNSKTPILYSIYYFDVQNGDQVLEKGATPIVAQRGPYAYDEHYEMFDIEFRHSRTGMAFFEQKYYVFNPEKSCAGCNDTADTITTLDLVAVELFEAVADAQVQGVQGTALQDAVVALLCETRGKVSPFTEKTIHSAHWGRWYDPVLLGIEGMAAKFNVSLPASYSVSYVPGFETNYTSHDMVRLLYGAKDQVKAKGAKSMRYHRYQGSKYVRSCLSPSIRGDDATQTHAACTPQDPAWDDMDEAQGEALAGESGWTLAYATREASVARGGSPTFVKPLNLNKGHFGGGVFYKTPQRFAKFIRTTFDRKRRAYRGTKKPHLFIDSVYRELTFERTLDDGHVSKRGIPLERYQLARGEQLSAGLYDYDQYETPYGVLNLTRAVGFPLLASQPHFFDSAPELQHYVVGLTPSRAIHNTYFDLEPRSGEIFGAEERLQFVGQLFNYHLPGTGDGLTCLLGSQGDWDLFPDRVNASAPGGKNHLGWLLPIGYIDQGYELNEDDTRDLKQDLVDIDGFCDSFFIVLLVVTQVALILAARAFYLSYHPYVFLSSQHKPNTRQNCPENDAPDRPSGHASLSELEETTCAQPCCPFLLRRANAKTKPPPPLGEDTPEPSSSLV